MAASTHCRGRNFRWVNSIVFGNDAENNADFSGALVGASGHNLIGTDPRFVRNPSPGTDGEWGTDDDDFGDLRPAANSAAVDTGLDAALPDEIEADLAGNPRLFGSHVDLGVHETQASPAEGRETPSNVVNTLTDTIDFYDGVVSLREALFYAETLDEPFSTIVFDESLDGETILLDGLDLIISTSVHIDASMRDSLTIDAGGKSRVFAVCGGPSEVAIENLHITGGFAPEGGGIYNAGASMTILDCVLTENEAVNNGGAVYSRNGSLSWRIPS